MCRSIAASGLTALEAELGTRGAEGARAHGWPEPYPDITEPSARLQVANDETLRRMQRCYGILEPSTMRDFMGAVDLIAKETLPT